MTAPDTGEATRSDPHGAATTASPPGIGRARGGRFW